VPQKEPLGYADAVYAARDCVGAAPFAHLVGDHLYVSQTAASCARQLLQTAQAHDCAVSSVQSTREGQLPYFGTIGGRRVEEHQRLYRIEQVVEKPTPTQAEQQLIIPGLRAGHYLCLFGIHVLTPAIFEIIDQQRCAGPAPSFSDALTELARREQFLALEMQGWRYDVGVKYGLLTAQLALGLSGEERDEVLAQLLELLALRHAGAHGPTATGSSPSPDDPGYAEGKCGPAAVHPPDGTTGS
jgi:UTP--glucose-1-phosphate uridylyltransferase